MKTAYFCEKCLYLYACKNSELKFCIKCEDTCFLGKEKYKKLIIGICPQCLTEGGGL